MIKITIIIPVYNTAFYVEDCVKSLISQSLNDIEIIIIDDGSTDNSLAVCNKLKKTDSRIKVISCAHKGASAARNRGIEEARGEYIYFLDSDDTISRDFLLNSYNTALEADCDVVITYLCSQWDIEPDKLGTLQTSANMIRTKLLKDNPDLRFPEGIMFGEDGIFFHLVYALANKICHNKKNSSDSYFYRQHKNQSHRYFYKNYKKCLHFIPTGLEYIKNFYDRHDLWKQKSVHLLRYLEHEPYNIRHRFIPNTDWIYKEYIHKIVRDFYMKYLKDNTNTVDFGTLSYNFREFLQERHYFCYAVRQFIPYRLLRYNLVKIYKRIGGGGTYKCRKYQKLYTFSMILELNPTVCLVTLHFALAIVLGRGFYLIIR